MNGKTNQAEPIPSRGEVLLTLTWCQNELQKKLKAGRFKDITLEKARNEKMRLLVYTCQVMAGILKDQDLDEIKQRITALESGHSENTVKQEGVGNVKSET